MKRLLVVSLALFSTVSLIAGDKPARPQFKPGSVAAVRRLPNDPARLPRLLAQYERATGKTAQAGRRIAPAAIGDMRSVRLLLFPAAGSVRGAGGEFFRSDITLINFDDTSSKQTVVVFWLQNGVTTDDPPAIELDLDFNVYYDFTDFVGTVLNRPQQLGAILMLPIDNAGEIDFDSSFDGYSRIWTNQPNATGTVSQPFPPVDPYTFYVFDTATIMGLRHDAQYRTNYGIVNVDDEPHTFQVHFLSESLTNSLTITVPANGMIQQAIPAGNYGNLVIEIDVDNGTAPWIGYASSTDNTTGDGWVAIGSGIFTATDLDDIGQ